MSRLIKYRNAVRVGREAEITEFLSMLAGDIEERILFACGPSGIGKSEFLRECVECCSKEIPKVIVDFAGGGISLSELFSRVCKSLGWNNFPIFYQRVEEYRPKSSLSVNVKNNFLLGRNKIQIDSALDSLDEEEREWRRGELTDAFFDDLLKFDRLVLAFDTYNDCDPVIRKWITGPFMFRVSKTPGLVLLIAGQIVPDIQSEWYYLCNQISLGVIERNYWHEYAKRVGAEIPSEDYIHALYDYLNGLPSLMADAISNYIPQV